MQTFEISVQDILVTRQLIDALLKQYFHDLGTKPDISVREVGGVNLHMTPDKAMTQLEAIRERTLGYSSPR